MRRAKTDKVIEMYIANKVTCIIVYSNRLLANIKACCSYYKPLALEFLDILLQHCVFPLFQSKSRVFAILVLPEPLLHVYNIFKITSGLSKEQ